MRTLLSPDNRLFALARSGKRLPPVWLAIPLGFVALVVLLVIGGNVALNAAIVLWPSRGITFGIPLVTTLMEQAQQQVFILLVTFVVPLLGLWLWVRAYEGRRFASLGFASPHGAARFGRGLLLGVLSFTATIGLLAAFDTLRIESDPRWQAAEGSPAPQGVVVLGPVLLVLVGWLFQGGVEEIVTRGWLMGVVGARSRPWIGVVVSSVLFALLHSLNPNVTVLGVLNTFLVGVFLALYALAEGGLWGVCAWHGAWNWAQGNVFGIAVSGNAFLSGTLIDFATAGPEWLTGGAYGIEAGLVATLVLAFGIALIALFPVSGRGRAVSFP